MDLISVHVAKTAGRSFLETLKAVYGEGAIIEDYRGQDNPVSGHHHKTDAEQVSQVSPDVSVIHGHFNSTKYEEFFPEAKRIVWLREPITRIVSHYFYLKRKKNPEDTLHQSLHDSNMSLIEFASVPVMRNQMSHSYLPMRLIESFDFVGICEHYDEELQSLGKLMNWPQVKSAVVNVTKTQEYRDFELDEKTEQAIREMNNKDIELYDKALELKRARKE